MEKHITEALTDLRHDKGTSINIESGNNENRFIKVPIGSYSDLMLMKYNLMKSIEFISERLACEELAHKKQQDFLYSIAYTSKLVSSIQEQLLKESEVLDVFRGFNL